MPEENDVAVEPISESAPELIDPVNHGDTQPALLPYPEPPLTKAYRLTQKSQWEGRVLNAGEVVHASPDQVGDHMKEVEPEDLDLSGGSVRIAAPTSCAGFIPLNGFGAANGVVTFAEPRALRVEFGGDDLGVLFTVFGTSKFGDPIQEGFRGGTLNEESGVYVTTRKFKTVTGLFTTGPTNGRGVAISGTLNAPDAEDDEPRQDHDPEHDEPFVGGVGPLETKTETGIAL
jgi:hypothetical protein